MPSTRPVVRGGRVSWPLETQNTGQLQIITTRADSLAEVVDELRRLCKWIDQLDETSGREREPALKY